MQGQSKIEFNLTDYISLIKEVIEGGGKFRLFPKGTSMLPILRQGIDSVLLAEPPIKLRKRDIILYQRESGQFVLHRILRVRNDGSFVLCGDNQTVLEINITFSNVIAVVTGIYRKEKYYKTGKGIMAVYEIIWCFMPFRKVIFFLKKILSKVKKIVRRLLT